MATRLYLHAALGNLTNGLFPLAEQSAQAANWSSTGATSIKKMDTTIGTTQTSIAGTSTATVAAQRGFIGMWRSEILTVGQSVSALNLVVNVADATSVLASNFRVDTCNVYLYNVYSGTLRSLYDGAAAAIGGTLATVVNSEQVTTFTNPNAGTTLTSVDGDCIVIELWSFHTQTAAAAYANTLYLDGAVETAVENTVVTNHASYIEFPTTFTFITDPLIGGQLTGFAGTAAVGSVLNANEQILDGNEATSAIGSSTLTTFNIPLVGNESIASNDILGVDKTATISTGVQATGAVGQTDKALPLSGNEASSTATGNVGTAGGTYPAAISGVESASIISSLLQNGAVLPASVEVVGQVGDLITLKDRTLTGVEAPGGVASLTKNVIYSISGVAATSAVSSIIVTTPITGVQAVGQTASLEELVDTGSLYSQALREAYASAPSNSIIIHTLEFRHPSFIDDSGANTALRVVRDWVDLTAYLEANAPLNAGKQVTFTAYAFDFQLPEMSGGAAPEITITIDNVSRLIEQNLERAILSPYPVEVTYRPYLSTDLSGPQMNPPLTMIIKSVETSDLSVMARAGFPDLANKRFPALDYTPTQFPGLIR
ncbi:Domain of unknown function DUF1833 [uncultured Caudovirales phage]|uniref:Uncharacterized protein n=1 Tax=uncultured Caudovirales phage TaxID=2100421 RepID=A0A6J5KL22_9CAUD|nr:Domain of unknown function DUF1833 [uncultured Caudovirales phage]CAB4123554.1 Domain of unknown function DUF1833 [uncultured Caudovirales phage]CAB5219731.1 Domain of unknown function DUF1833 [uncultured Caudovirales phage]